MGSLSPPHLTCRRPPESPPSSYIVPASFINPSPDSSVPNWIDGYHPATNSWHKITFIPGLHEKRVLKGFAMAPISNSIYIIGGKIFQKVAIGDGSTNDVVEEDLDIVRNVWRYNMDDATWEECVPLTVPRFDFACNVRGVSCAEVYDSRNNTWKSVNNMSTSRYKCVGVTWHNRSIVIGGFTDKPVSNTEHTKI
ncbi:unnamed protein product [Rhodiola kirilowii]